MTATLPMQKPLGAGLPAAVARFGQGTTQGT